MYRITNPINQKETDKVSNHMNCCVTEAGHLNSTLHLQREIFDSRIHFEIVALSLERTSAVYCTLSIRLIPGIAEACPPADTGEATEKLYERHCLVIKIVSSFFCFSDKVFVSLSVDLQ